MAEQTTIPMGAPPAAEAAPGVVPMPNVAPTLPPMGHVQDETPAAGAVALLGGWVGPDGRWHRTAVVDEMTGYDEDLLAGGGPRVPRFNRILANCVQALGDVTDRALIAGAVEALTPADRALLLVTIRRLTVGDFFDVRLPCPGPKGCPEAPYALDLREIAGVAVAAPGDRYEDALPRGAVVRWHMMTGCDEAWLEGALAGADADDQTFTLPLLARVDAVDGVALDRVRDRAGAVAALRRLKKRDRVALRALMEAREPSIDLTAHFTCPTCGHRWSDGIPVAAPGFFFPPATSPR